MPSGDQIASLSCEPELLVYCSVIPSFAGTTNKSPRAIKPTFFPSGDKVAPAILSLTDTIDVLASGKSLRLFYIDIDSKTTTLITKSTNWEIRDFSWSPDSKWVTYTDYINEDWPVVSIYNLANKKITPVTSEFFQSYNPIFSQDGNYFV